MPRIVGKKFCCLLFYEELLPFPLPVHTLLYGSIKCAKTGHKFTKSSPYLLLLHNWVTSITLLVQTIHILDSGPKLGNSLMIFILGPDWYVAAQHNTARW